MQEQLLRTYAQTEEQIKAKWEDHPHLTYWLLTLSMGKHIAQAIVAWCDETLKILEKMQQEASMGQVQGR